MSYLGDYAEDYATLNFAFTSRAFATGIPTVLAGSPVIAVYKGSATGTEKTSAESYITLAVDFDSVVGLNNVLIDLSGDAFFAVGEDYKVVITTGTVGGVSVVGETVGTFSIENRWDSDTLKPTTAGRTLDVTAGGAAGIDWGNIENKTTANDLSATDIQLVDTTTTNTDMVGTDSAALASVCTETRLAALTDWLNGGRLDLILDIIAADTTTDIPALIATAQADLDIITGSDGVNLLSATQTQVDTIATDTARLTAVRAAVLTDWIDAGRLDALLDAIKAKTDSLTFTTANQVDANMQSINDTALVGDGSATPWGP